MKNIVNKRILSVKPYVPGKPIEEVKRELKLRSVIKLASNENPYGPSPKVIKALSKAIKNVNRYPYSDCYYLRKELSKKFKIKPNQLIFGNGSDELIVLAVRLFVNQGDEVVVAKPSFLIYSIASKLAGASIKEIPLKNFCYDLPAMKKTITKKTKIIFLGNPDNPSGNYLKKKDLDVFLKGIRRDILIFMDEAYYDYVNKKDYADSVKLQKKYKNIFVTRTFSKMYGLAGLRIGYGIANVELIDLFNIIREPFNVNSLAQEAALACLKDQGYYKKLLKKHNSQKEYIYRNLERLGLSYTKTYTNFILIEVKNNSTKILKKLMKKGVIVRDMSHWGLNNYIRITIGTKRENEKLIKALEKII